MSAFPEPVIGLNKSTDQATLNYIKEIIFEHICDSEITMKAYIGIIGEYIFHHGTDGVEKIDPSIISFIDKTISMSSRDDLEMEDCDEEYYNILYDHDYDGPGADYESNVLDAEMEMRVFYFYNIACKYLYDNYNISVEMFKVEKTSTYEHVCGGMINKIDYKKYMTS